MKQSLIIFCSVIIVATIFIQSNAIKNVQLLPPGNCSAKPKYLQKMIKQETQAAYSTSEKRMPGIHLLIYEKDSTRRYQHPSWKTAGWMGSFVVDSYGHAYIVAASSVNTLINPKQNRNTIYKIDGNTGIMSPWVKLPMAVDSFEINPFGCVGINNSCYDNNIYVTSIAGSTPKNERGVIYQIDAKTNKVLSTLKNKDAFGIAVTSYKNGRRLYFGSARTPNLYSVGFTKDGKIGTDVQLEFSTEDILTDGFTTIRKIRENADLTLDLFLIDFNFNLEAPTEKQEKQVTIKWNPQANVWNLIAIK
jgi:hypothetical protein